MTDQPKTFSSPPDEMGRLAEKMIALVGRPGLRGTVMLDDDTVETAMVVPFGYNLDDKNDVSFMFAEIADHMVNLWQAFGMRLDLMINGKLMPSHPVHGEEDTVDNGRDRNIVSGFLAALEARVAAIEADIEKAAQLGDQELVKLKTAFAAELKALATEIQNAFRNL